MPSYVEPTFERDTDYIEDRITADGGAWPVEPGRYRLVVARACPWANRAIIVRRLLGLEDVLSMGVCGPTHDERSWTFDLDPGGVDPVLHIPRIQDAYLAPVPGLPQGHHRALHRRRALGRGRHQRLRPDDARPVDAVAAPTTARVPPTSTPRRCGPRWTTVMKRVYTEVNNGVYRCGFAGTQEAYDAAYDRLFATLDWLSDRLRRPTVPHGRHHHRGRRPPVHDPGPVRRGLPRALQVQPAEAHRDAGAVGVCPRPVPDAGLRRHHRLRPHQAALLRRPPGHQPDRHRPRRADPRAVGRAARSGGPRWPARSGTAPPRARSPPAKSLRPHTTRRWRCSDRQ